MIKVRPNMINEDQGTTHTTPGIEPIADRMKSNMNKKYHNNELKFLKKDQKSQKTKQDYKHD